MAAGDTILTNIAELVPEITLEASFIFQNASIGRALVTVEDITSRPGVTVEFPKFTEVSGSTGVAETGVPTSHQMDLTMPTLTVARRSVYVRLGDLAKKGSSSNIVSQIGHAMGMAMAKQVDTSIFNVVTGTTNYATGTGSTNASLTITNILDGQNLLELNEVSDELYGVWHPKQYKSIRAALTPIANDDGIAVGIADEMSRNGFTARAFGINHFVTNRISTGTVTATAGVYNGLLFARPGIGYGFSWLGNQGVEVERSATEALSKLIINYADSAGVIDGNAVCKVYSI